MSEPVLKELPYRIEKSQHNKPFWDGLNEGKLRTTQCKKCGTKHYPPQPILCSKCFSREIEWIDLELSGEINSWTHVTSPPQGFLKDYMMVTVEIDGLGKPILGRYSGSEHPNIGDRVKVGFEKVGDQSFFIFNKYET